MVIRRPLCQHPTGVFRVYKKPWVQTIRVTHGHFAHKKAVSDAACRPRPVSSFSAACQLWSLRKMGAVRPRAKALTGSALRPHAPKLSVVWSFISIAILRSTFLLNLRMLLITIVALVRCTASISRRAPDCQAAVSPTFGGCFSQSATVPHFCRCLEQRSLTQNSLREQV